VALVLYFKIDEAGLWDYFVHLFGGGA
jgi:hypothetical protein